jgi:hypothetical protein
MIDRYVFTDKPTMGIFMKYEGYKTAQVFIKNSYWTVELDSISFAGVQHAS